MATSVQKAEVQIDEIRNGVNVTALKETVTAVGEQPGLAEFQFRAKNRWVDGAHNRIVIKDYYGQGKEQTHRTRPFILNADEPPVLLGKDNGANPVEYVLAAISSCMTTSLAYHAAVNGVEIQAIESDWQGDINLKGFLGVDPAVRKGYREIRVNFKVKSDASPAELEKLAKMSPVYDIVTNPTPVKIAFIKG